MLPHEPLLVKTGFSGVIWRSPRSTGGKVDKIIERDFPERLFYRHVIAAETVFKGSVFKTLIMEKSPQDPLAAHLACLPTLLVMHRQDPTEKGSFYVRLFKDAIKLEKWETDVYKKWYPYKKLLLYAPYIPQYGWFADYVVGRSLKNALFKYN